MARTLQLHDHLTVAELFQRYKAASTAADARRYHALWLISQGSTAKTAAALVGLSDKWVRALVQRYNQRGTNPGKVPLLNDQQRQALARALQSPPAEGGVWTGKKVAAWIERHTGVKTYPQRGWVYLRRLGFTPQLPRPRHVQAATDSEQAAWKKNSGTGSAS